MTGSDVTLGAWHAISYFGRRELQSGPMAAFDPLRSLWCEVEWHRGIGLVFGLSKLIWLVPIAALGAALLDMPYGYFQLLRVLVFCATAYLAFESQRCGDVAWAWVLGGTAIIYNPFFKLALGRELWTIVNIATIIVFIVHWVSAGRKWENSRPER